MNKRIIVGGIVEICEVLLNILVYILLRQSLRWIDTATTAT